MIARMKFIALRQEMLANGLNQSNIADLIGRSMSYVSARLSGEKSWELNECYIILEQLNVPFSEFSTYFPKNGGEQRKGRK